MKYIHQSGRFCSKKTLIFLFFFLNDGDGGFVFFVQVVVCKVIVCFVADNAIQSDNANKVGDGHEAVGDIGEIPHYIALMNHATDVDGKDPQQAVGDDEPATAEILQRFFAVVGPAQEGGDGESR